MQKINAISTAVVVPTRRSSQGLSGAGRLRVLPGVQRILRDGRHAAQLRDVVVLVPL